MPEGTGRAHWSAVERRPVLVTGSNRSGTTWVGEALCQSDELDYVHEPFNSSLWPRLLEVPLGGHYTYVSTGNEAPFLRSAQRLMANRYPLRAQLPEVRSPRDGARLARDWGRSLARKARRRRLLVKDPIALFASEWLAERFDVLVVVMIRHPAAFAGSIKRLGWAFDFRYLLSQDLLMRDHLGPFRDELVRFAAAPQDLIDQAVLLWRIFYTYVDRLRSDHPDWRFIRYEDLAEDPVAGFAALYPNLGLRFDDGVAARVAGFSAAGNVVEVAATDRGPTRRDSRAAKWTWTTRLEPGEVARVRAGVADVAPRFYGEESWQGPAYAR